MEDYRQIIAGNISQLRKAKGMTQLELAEALNYTDKAVSKWERGESIPDAIVLKQIADMFNVSIDYLFVADHSYDVSQPNSNIRSVKRRLNNRKFITGMSIILVWFIATLVFVILRTVLSNYRDLLCFVYALPVSLIVWLVLNSIWFSRRKNYLIISMLMWSILVAICITLLIFAKPAFWFLLLGIPGQAIIWLWSHIIHTGKKNKNNKSRDVDQLQNAETTEKDADSSASDTASAE